jgi:hypothetical protein
MDPSALLSALSAVLPEVDPLRQIGGIEVEYNETTRTTTLRHLDPEDVYAVLILPAEILPLVEYLLAIQYHNSRKDRT